jgi:hypothetical protein
MALAPDIGLLLTCEIDKYIDLVASERVHELYGVLHYRNPIRCARRGTGDEAELGPRLSISGLGDANHRNSQKCSQ